MVAKYVTMPQFENGRMKLDFILLHNYILTNTVAIC